MTYNIIIMYVVNNQDQPVFNLTQEQYNLILNKVEIFRLDQCIRISDIYCGSRENTIEGLDALYKLMNHEEIGNVESLTHALKLIDGLCIELNENERKFIKSQTSIHGLEHVYPELFDGEDFVLAKVITGNQVKLINNSFYHNNKLYFVHEKSLCVYNFKTLQIECIHNVIVNTDHQHIINFYMVNEYVYLYIEYIHNDYCSGYPECRLDPAFWRDMRDSDSDEEYNEDYEWDACYKINTTNYQAVKINPEDIGWLCKLYGFGERIRYTGIFPKYKKDLQCNSPNTSWLPVFLGIQKLDKENSFESIYYDNAGKEFIGTKINLNIGGKIHTHKLGNKLHVTNNKGENLCTLKYDYNETLYFDKFKVQDGQILVFKYKEVEKERSNYPFCDCMGSCGCAKFPFCSCRFCNCLINCSCGNGCTPTKVKLHKPDDKLEIYTYI